MLKLRAINKTKLSTYGEQINSLNSATNSTLLENRNPNNKKEEDKF